MAPTIQTTRRKEADILHTAVTDLLGIRHPICSAGMAGYSSPELVGAVSSAGGLGVIGGLDRDPSDMRAVIQATKEYAGISASGNPPFGVNFVVPFIVDGAFDVCLQERVPVICFSWGHPGDRIERAHEAGAKVICQVTTVEEVPALIEAGVDALIAQGTEAGGHSGAVPLFALLPAVVALASGLPVLAAGGIVDGRGLAAAMAMGAAGGWLGTRFLATPEANARPSWKRAIAASREGATVHTLVFDTLWGRAWPGARIRALRNAFTDEWDGREEELARQLIPASANPLRERIWQAEREDDPSWMALMAGAGAGGIKDIRPAADLVRDIAAEAEAVIAGLARLSR